MLYMACEIQMLRVCWVSYVLDWSITLVNVHVVILVIVRFTGLQQSSTRDLYQNGYTHGGAFC